MALIPEMVGWILAMSRPRRMSVDGEPAARDRAVSAPMPPWEGPVMRKVRPWTWDWKAAMMALPSVLMLYSDIVEVLRIGQI